MIFYVCLLKTFFLLLMRRGKIFPIFPRRRLHRRLIFFSFPSEHARLDFIQHERHIFSMRILHPTFCGIFLSFKTISHSIGLYNRILGIFENKSNHGSIQFRHFLWDIQNKMAHSGKMCKQFFSLSLTRYNAVEHYKEWKNFTPKKIKSTSLSLSR